MPAINMRLGSYGTAGICCGINVGKGDPGFFPGGQIGGSGFR